MARGSDNGAGNFSIDDEPTSGGVVGENGDASGGGDNRGDGSGRDDGAREPGAIFGSAIGGGDGADDDRIIRDEHGNPTFSPSGRLRKRRRSGGSGSRQASKGAKVPVDALAQLLMMGHGLLSNVTRTPEIEITNNEGNMLAKPLSELLELYNVAPSREIMLWMALVSAGSYVYAPRVVMIRNRLAYEREERRRKSAEAPVKAEAQPSVGGVVIGEVLDLDNIQPGSFTGPSDFN